MTPDVNVLVAASRDDHPQHRVALTWLEGALAAAEYGGSFVLLPVVLVGFLRIVTQARIFPDPTPVPRAIEFIRSILARAGVELATLGGEWPMVARLCELHGLSGNDVTDAWIAAAVLERDEHLVTFDRGFRRFVAARDLTVLAP